MANETHRLQVAADRPDGGMDAGVSQTRSEFSLILVWMLKPQFGQKLLPCPIQNTRATAAMAARLDGTGKLYELDEIPDCIGVDAVEQGKFLVRLALLVAPNDLLT
jgi:hypothetical protein